MSTGSPPPGRFTAASSPWSSLFRSDLGFYVHLHCLVTDGAFEERGCELPFLAAPPPTPERITAILARVHDVIVAQDPDAELDLDPALATCVQQSLRGPRLAAAAPDTEPRPGTISAFGMHLHAATTVDGRDRKRLEHVCRYLLRPPFAHDAVEAPAKDLHAQRHGQQLVQAADL